MSIDIDGLIAEFNRRTGQPAATSLDAEYNYQSKWLRQLLARAAVAMEDEGIPEATVDAVLKRILLGSPSAHDAEERIRIQRAHAEQIRRMQYPGILIGTEPPSRVPYYSLGDPPKSGE